MSRLIYPVVMVAEWETVNGPQRLVVHFTSKNTGKVLERSKDQSIRYKVGETYNDFYSAENSKKWKRLQLDE